MALVRKFYIVGVMVDDRLPDRVPLNYIQRSIKRYHEEVDIQNPFHGVNPPERVTVIEADLNSLDKSLEYITRVFNTMDRIEGKK